MRVPLLIDELYPSVMAVQLRRVGHDATSVTEDPESTGLDDARVCDLAVAAGRAIVTENAADFPRIVKERAATGRAVPTLLITTNRSFPRHSRSFVDRAVRALASFCEEHADDAPDAGAVHWLRPMS